MNLKSGTSTAKRRSIAAVAVISAVALTAAGCGGSSGSATASKPSTDHVLRLSFLQDPGQPPDPDIFYSGQGLVLTQNTYEGLLRYKPGTETPTLEPLLATEWTASPDNKVFTFALREGVTFHDGTPFTSAAIKTSFDRRLAVNQGPAYMVSDVESVTTDGDFAATITLTEPNSAFLAYLASPYGPRMMSPTALAANAGTDNAQTYLTTNDVGTGPYSLDRAEVGSHYSLAAYDGYWGEKPYFTQVELPVITDASSQQLQFNNGELDAITYGVPSSAVQSYIDGGVFSTQSLPTMMSDYMYVNPNKGMFTDQAVRRAFLQSVDTDALAKQAYFGRGEAAEQVYPPNMMAAEFAQQNITHDPTVLENLVSSMPADKKSIVIGYDSSSSDNQLAANLLSANLSQIGVTASVQSFPTAQIFEWAGDPGAGPDVLLNLGWPDAPPPYTWGHISFDQGAGLNYLNCSSPEVSALLAEGLTTGSDQTFSDAAVKASETGCWMNLVDVSDFIVAQPWLKGIEESHMVSAPTSLNFATLTVDNAGANK
ncbi:ABC transporter substrate-binding protein [Rhodococcus sp. SRB_17]|nr:ABC transporter substrate-binding protein [Rhodococcus sp. SRB_17]